MVLKVFGPVVLRAFLGNNSGRSNTGSGTVELEDDDDDDDDDDEASSTTAAPTRRKRALFFLPV